MIPDETLLRALGPECKLVFWLAPGALGEKTPGFTTINYVLDGLLRGHLSEHSQDIHQVVFNHQTFGNAFQVVFLDSSDKSSASFLPTALPILNKERALLYTAEAVPAEWLKFLQKTYSDLATVEIR